MLQNPDYDVFDSDIQLIRNVFEARIFKAKARPVIFEDKAKAEASISK